MSFRSLNVLLALLILVFSILPGLSSADICHDSDQTVDTLDGPNSDPIMDIIFEARIQQAEHAAKAIFIATIIKPVYYIDANQHALVEARWYQLRAREKLSQERMVYTLFA